MLRTKNVRIASIAVAIGLAATACGGDDATSDTAGGESEATTADDSDAGSEDSMAEGDEPAEDEAAEGEAAEDGAAEDGAAGEGTLQVLIHQNPPGVEFIEEFNKQFEADNPGVTVDLSVVNADDIPTQNQTRLSANDIDVTTISVTGFANPVQDYMTDAEPPYWQQLIDAELVMDLSDQDYINNYDEAAVADGTYNGKVYGVNLGRTIYSGMFVNQDLLAEVGVDIPTTWDEFVAACDAVVEAGSKCMVAGGQDGWPVFVGTYGLLGSLYPDQQGLVEGLWTGASKWNDETGSELFEKYGTFAERLDAESAGLTADAAAERWTVGDVAFGPMGAWNAAVIEEQAPFEWTYIPFPGSDDAANNETFFGKYDMTFAVAQGTDVPDLAHAYLAAFSEPDNYQAFVNATSYLPAQPTATLDNKLGQATSEALSAGNFTVGFEQFWIAPTGAGERAPGFQGAQWLYNGDFGTPAEAADAAQSDLEAGL